MSAHVLLNLLNELGKRDKMRGLPRIYLFFATSLINSIIHHHIIIGFLINVQVQGHHPHQWAPFQVTG